MKINYSIKPGASFFRKGDRVKIKKGVEYLLADVHLDAKELDPDEVYTIHSIPPGYPNKIDDITYRYDNKDRLICIHIGRFNVPIVAVYKV